jgi:serine/threonine-protein kinase
MRKAIKWSRARVIVLITLPVFPEETGISTRPWYPDTMPDPAPDHSGRALGDFLLLRRIGQGGMGQVYLARQQSLKRDVALKLLRPDLAADATALQRFRAEAEAVARVTHANIVQVHAVGEQDGLHYMALEYVDGRNLRDFLAKKGPPDLPVALAIMRQVAAALQRASELGIAHRDIKPENILITRKGEVKVADFGLSRVFAGEAPAMNLTQTGITLGTPVYMSPEQVQGRPADHRSDIYSFGVTCYHLLTGEPPFKGATAFEVAVQHVQTDPPPLSDTRPDLPADLTAMVHRMMAKQPDDRYQSAKDILRDLTKVREGLGLAKTGIVPAVPPRFDLTSSSPSQVALAQAATLAMTGPSPRRSWGRWIAAGLLVAVLAGGGWAASALLGGRRETPTAEPGLPTQWPQEAFTSTRERGLKETFENRNSTPDQFLHAGVELGLLYVKEGRLDEAGEVFAALENERPVRMDQLKMQTIGNPFQMAGLCGKAVVLSHRDKPEASDVALQQAHMAGLRPVKDAPRPRPGGFVLQNFLLQMPELSRAVADAVLRNEENLTAAKKPLPTGLKWLKSPASLAAGPGG